MTASTHPGLLPPISGYAPHPDRSAWLVVLVIAAVLYVVLTLPR